MDRWKVAEMLSLANNEKTAPGAYRRAQQIPCFEVLWHAAPNKSENR